MEAQQQKKPKRKSTLRWVVLGFLCVWVVLLWKQCQCTYQMESNSLVAPTQNEGWIPLDSGASDTIPLANTTSAVTQKNDSQMVVEGKDPIQKTSSKKNTEVQEKKSEAIIDTLFLWADPWGGRHFGSVKISLYCKQNCQMQYRWSGEEASHKYEQPLLLEKSDTLFFYGQNEIGERSTEIAQYYKIEPQMGKCHEKGGEPLSMGDKPLCIDRYEWPNQKNEKPRVYVTQSEAAKECQQIGKRLCTVDEWQRACSGPHNQNYPYDAFYTSGYCPDKEKESRRSGHLPTCRSFEGIFDLAGNVWEWTATAKDGRDGFYYAVGGAWDSGNDARCDEQKYSFYPQNKYVFLGFRCCWEEK